jgi:hypothetical protein
MKHYRATFDNQPVHSQCLTQVGALIPAHLSPLVIEQLTLPLTMPELRNAVRGGALQKSPSADGIAHEFYTHNWDILKSDLLNMYNVLLQQKSLPPPQVVGTLVSIPKTTSKDCH